jgi:hypothetical protein
LSDAGELVEEWRECIPNQMMNRSSTVTQLDKLNANIIDTNSTLKNTKGKIGKIGIIKLMQMVLCCSHKGRCVLIMSFLIC